MNTLSAQSGEEFVREGLVARVAEESERWSEAQTKKELLFLGVRPTLTEDDIEACATRCDELADAFPDALGESPTDEDMAAWISSAAAASDAYEAFVENLRTAVDHIRRQEAEFERQQQSARIARQMSLDKLTNKLAEWEQELAGTQHQGQRTKLEKMIAEQKGKIAEKRGTIERQDAVIAERAIDRESLVALLKELAVPAGACETPAEKTGELIASLRAKYASLIESQAQHWYAGWKDRLLHSKDINAYRTLKLGDTPENILARFQDCIDGKGAFTEHVPMVDGLMRADVLRGMFAGAPPEVTVKIMEKLEEYRASLASAEPVKVEKGSSRANILLARKARELFVVEQLDEFRALGGAQVRVPWRTAGGSAISSLAVKSGIDWMRVEMSYVDTVTKQKILVRIPIFPDPSKVAELASYDEVVRPMLQDCLARYGKIKDLYTDWDSARKHVHIMVHDISHGADFPPQLLRPMLVNSAKLYMDALGKLPELSRARPQFTMRAAISMDIARRLETQEAQDAVKHLEKPVITDWHITEQETFRTPRTLPSKEEFRAELDALSAWDDRSREDRKELARQMEYAWELSGRDAAERTAIVRSHIEEYMQFDALQSFEKHFDDGQLKDMSPEKKTYAMLEAVRRFAGQHESPTGPLHKAQVSHFVCTIRLKAERYFAEIVD